jgi:hypothetical protein
MVVFHMRFSKSRILLSLIGLMFLSSSAFAEQYGDFTYTVSGGSVTIAGYNCPNGSPANPAAVIPSAIGGLPVTGIGYRAFDGCYDLTSVNIPDSVTSIGVYAFWNCIGLTSVDIPDSVTNIEEGAFVYCYGLATAYFHGNAPSMGQNVFLACASNFTVCYTAGSSGFTAPTWNGYPAAQCVEESSSTTSVTSTATSIQPLTTTTTTSSISTTITSTSTTTIIEPALKADFARDKASGPPPLVVQFTDMSSGNITSYSWDFGDNSTSADKDPSHTYLSAGTYTVGLSIKGNGGKVDNEVKYGYITVKYTSPTTTTTAATTTVPADAGCPAIAVMGDGGHDIKTLRAFRNEMFTRTAVGKYYTFLYYKNAFELRHIFTHNEELKEQASSVVQKIMPTMTEMLLHRDAAISEETLKRAIELIDALKVHASPILKKDLARLKKDIHNGVILSTFRIKVRK